MVYYLNNKLTCKIERYEIIFRCLLFLTFHLFSPPPEQLSKVEKDLTRSGNLSPEFRKELEVKKRELVQDLQLRTAQITDIQQKVSEQQRTIINKDFLLNLSYYRRKVTNYRLP